MEQHSRSAAPGGAAFGQDPASRKPSRSWLPVVSAVVVVAVVVCILLAVGGHRGGQAQSSAYAGRLTIGNIQMSTSGNLGGGSETYLDGTVTNNGAHTVDGVTIQVVFHDFSGAIAARDTMPITLIRSRQPYVDVEPVSAAPIGPGQTRGFRVAFDSVPDSWNQSYPDVHIVGVQLK